MAPELGFDKAFLRKDLTAEGMKAALRQFAREAVGADIALRALPSTFGGTSNRSNG
jgi:hypothetical protein